MQRIIEFFGLGRNKGVPQKEQGKRNLWLAGLAALGVFMLVFSGSLAGGKAEKREPSPQAESITTMPESSMSREEENLSTKLCGILRQVEGAGRVEVSVRLSSSTRSEYAVNTSTGKKTTQERDQSGGTRLITEDTGNDQLVMNRNGSGSEQPVVERELSPQVAGVLIVAEGAGDSRIRAKLFAATRVALGIEPQKIIVLPMERRE